MDFVIPNQAMPLPENDLLSCDESTQSNQEVPSSRLSLHTLYDYRSGLSSALAKSMIQHLEVGPNSVLLDPFCADGSLLLEGLLAGHQVYGCDLNPWAAKLTKAKLGMLMLTDCQRDTAKSCILALMNEIKEKNRIQDFHRSSNEYDEHVMGEIYSWFPEPVVYKLNWLMERIRRIGQTVPHLVDFLEVLVGSCLLAVSQQEQFTDHRSKVKRKTSLIEDAPVTENFLELLEQSLEMLQSQWKSHPAKLEEQLASFACPGDSRSIETFKKMGLTACSVDVICSSMPMAIAPCHIDQNRLAMMVLIGVSARNRKKLEESMMGSSEITFDEVYKLRDGLFWNAKPHHSNKEEKSEPEIKENLLEKLWSVRPIQSGAFLSDTKERRLPALALSHDACEESQPQSGKRPYPRLPKKLTKELQDIFEKNVMNDSGIRRQSVFANLYKYCLGMNEHLAVASTLLKPNGKAYYLVKDNIIRVGSTWHLIKLAHWISILAKPYGFKVTKVKEIPIDLKGVEHITHKVKHSTLLLLEKSKD